jgi:microtubule-associated protein-like 6
MTWAVQGLWSKTAEIPDYLVNACQAVPDLEVVLSGDSAGFVNLHRFPQPGRDALHQIYSGHAGPVSNVAFSSNRYFAISLGETDRVIMVWKHEIEDHDSDDEQDDTSAIPLELLISADKSKADPFEAVEKPSSASGKPWKKAVVEPILAEKVPVSTTDVDLVLQWVHGFRSSDCRNNLRYTSAGEITFHAAAVVNESKDADGVVNRCS